MSHYFRIAKGLLFGYSSSLLNFLLFLFLASQLEIGKYAVVMIAIAIGSFLAPLLNLGSEKVLVPSVVAAASADGVAKILSRNFMRRFYMLLLVYFGIGLVVCIRADSEDSLALILLSYWAVLLGFYPTAWYDYKRDTVRQCGMVFIERLLVLLVVSTSVIIFGVGELLFLGIVLLSIRSASLFYQYYFWWKTHSLVSFVSSTGSGSAGVSYLVATAFLLNGVLLYGNQLILAEHGSPVEIAAYGLAFQVISLILLFQSIAVRFLSRSIADACINQKASRSALFRTGFLVGGCSLLLAVMAWLIVEFLPTLLEDERYSMISDFFWILCVWVVFVGMGQVVTHYALAFGMQNTYTKISVSSGIIAMLLGLYFIPIYGAVAVSWVLIVVHTGAMCSLALIVVNHMDCIESTQTD